MEDVSLKILHLSDLHFGNMQPGNWNNLVERIRGIRLKPKIIIISGDVCECPIFHARKFKIAKEKIVNLAKLCRADVFITPGNHDVGIRGSLSLGPLTRKRFNKWFQNEHLDKKAFITSLDQEFILEILEKYKLLIVPFDSTRKPFISSGEVDKEEIDKLDNLVHESRSRESIHGQRIAIVHHHPLPVTSFNGDIWREPFLVFKNAGYFIFSLSEQRFDILLHGHKHIQNFCKISLETKDVKSKMLAVVGLGSSTKEPPPNKSNNYNVISFHQNGEIKIDQFFYGGGRAKKQEAIVFRKPDERKEAVYLNSLELQGFGCKSIEKKVTISKTDATKTTIRFNELKVVNRDLVKTYRPFRVEVGSGRIYKPYLSPSPHPEGFELRLDKKKSDSKKKIGIIRMRNLSADDPEISYGFEYRSRNDYALKRNEDIINVDICCACEQLKLEVKFPKELADFPEKENPRLYIYYNPHIMHARRNQEGELIVYSKRRNNWDFDKQMTKFEKGNLEKVGKLKWELRINNPLVGYRYEIRWGMPN